MKIRKVIQKKIDHQDEGVQVAGDVNAVVSANVNEPGSKNHVSSRQSKARVVQRGGRAKHDD